MDATQKSKIIRKTLFLCLAVFFIYLMTLFLKTVNRNIYNAGNFVGITASAALALCCLANEKIELLIKNLWKKTIGKVLLIILSVILALGITWCAIINVWMISAMDNQPDTPKPAIVLGCRLYGSTISPMLMRRLEAAEEYLKKYPDVKVVVSGGQGSGEDVSEAKVMKDYLVSKGIDEDRILMEDKSVNTYENIKFSKALLEEIGEITDEVVIITDGFHQYRAGFLAKKNGIKAYAINAETNPDYVPTYWVREWIGITKDIILSAF